MRPAHIAIVLNSSSGHGEATKVAAWLEELFGEAGRVVRITLARSGPELHGAATRVVEEGCAALVGCGGDGTVNAVASAVVGRDIPLGVLPLGTLNHFAKDAGIPLELDAAVQVILDGAVCPVDVGEVNGRVFLNNSSLGVYPAVVRLRERYRASGLGKWIAALWAGLAIMRRHPFMAVRIMAEGQAIVRRTPFVFVGKQSLPHDRIPRRHPRLPGDGTSRG